MATSQQCRQYAGQCLILAENADSPETKVLLVTMAYAWHSLAQDQENIERLVADLDAARGER
jgi:hypothetical protein